MKSVRSGADNRQRYQHSDGRGRWSRALEPRLRL